MEGKIVYRDFYDVPRAFVVWCRGKQFLFDSQFDVDKDDYRDIYEVFQLPELSKDELSGSWLNIRDRASRKLGEVKVDEVQFDQTKRKSISCDALSANMDERLTAPKNREGGVRKTADEHRRAEQPSFRFRGGAAEERLAERADP